MEEVKDEEGGADRGRSRRERRDDMISREME